jgi:hypothetical protein
MISEERLEKAMRFLAESDMEAAELKVQMERKSYLVDLSRRKIFTLSEGNVEERKAQAELAPETKAAEEEYLQAMLEWEKLKAKRATEELIVEVWRSLEASRRQGRI